MTLRKRHRRRPGRLEQRVLAAWASRQRLVFDERGPRTHRLTCVAPDLTAGEPLAQLEGILREVVGSGIHTMVVDLRRVKRADSRLIGTLVTVARRARSAGIRLVLHPSEPVDQWIEVCRVRCVFAGANRDCLDPGSPAPALA
jgi:anti-anti-sigma regulatory factor